MSDLIERPKSIGEAWRKLIQQQAEIERLNVELDILESLYNASVKRVEQLQAVVDADKRAFDSISMVPGSKGDRAALKLAVAIARDRLAALEGADDE